MHLLLAWLPFSLHSLSQFVASPVDTAEVWHYRTEQYRTAQLRADTSVQRWRRKVLYIQCGLDHCQRSLIHLSILIHLLSLRLWLCVCVCCSGLGQRALGAGVELNGFPTAALFQSQLNHNSQRRRSPADSTLQRTGPLTSNDWFYSHASAGLHHCNLLASVMSQSPLGRVIV